MKESSTPEVEKVAPLKKKKRVDSKAKGNGFEGTVAKLLGVELAPLKFLRTPGSGARVGGKNFETIGQMFGEDALKMFVGDVVPLNERDVGKNFRVSVECKFYKQSDSFEVITAGKCMVFGWMQESVVDAKKVNKIPVIIFKWNRSPIYVGVLQENSPGGEALKLTQNGVSIDVFYASELLKNKAFWVEDRNV